MSDEYALTEAVELTETYDEIVDTMEQYVEEMKAFEETVEEYGETVDAHRSGEATDADIAMAMEEVIEGLDEVAKYRNEVRDGIESVHVYLGMADQDVDYTAIVTEAQLAAERLEERVGETPEAIDGIETLTAVYNGTAERHDELEDAVYEHDDYLEDAIGTTLVDEQWEDDPMREAKLDQMKERAIAEQRQEEPNDLRLPEIVGNDYESIEAAREAVRERSPAGFYGTADADTGPTPEEREAISERVEAAREDVMEKDDIRGIQ